MHDEDLDSKLEAASVQSDAQPTPPSPAKEIGGRAGPDPTRYGDWEKGGRCIDF